MMTFGQRVTIVRKQRRLTQTALGERVGTSGDIIGKYERGEMKPSVETARKLADALGVSLDYLTGTEEANVPSEETRRRMQEIEQLPEEDRARIYHLIDALIRDARARSVYGVE